MASNATPNATSNRRDFLRSSVAVSAGLPLATALANEPTPTPEVRRYATLGRTGYKISDISFGTSRLRTGQEHLIHHALDRGINYFDTAEGYTDGDSETCLGNALKGKRDQVIITSKVQQKADSSAEWLMSMLDGSLRRLQMDYVDVYMNHAVNDIDVVANPEWHAFLDKAKAQGKIRYTGVSGHAGNLVECLDYVFDEDLVDAVLVAYNFGQDPKFYERISRGMDWVATQADLPKALERGRAKGVGVTVMKTLRGGRLNDMRPFEREGGTYAQSALRWAISHEQVDAAVITMKSTAEIDEFLGASGAEKVAYADLQMLERYAYLNKESYCNNVCNDCSGACPYNVPIQDVMRTRMYAVDYQDVDFARSEYARLGTNASACLTCDGQPCAGACTQGIAIDQLCGPTHALLA